MLKRVKEVCRKFIDVEEMQSIAEQEMNRIKELKQNEDTIKTLSAKIDNLTNHLNRVYSNKLSGVLSENDFMWIYARIKEERALLQEKLDNVKEETLANESGSDIKVLDLVNRFLNTVEVNKELIFSLIDRVEITKDRKVLIYFRFQRLEHLS